MLVRAARRKTRPDATRGKFSTEQLYLPWLCPAYDTSQRIPRRQIQIDASKPNYPKLHRRTSNDGLQTSARRSLATAVNRNFDDIPFVSLQNDGSDFLAQQSPSPFTTLRPFDQANPLMLGSLSKAPPRVRQNRTGIGGDFGEILSIFRACLQVGRMERAAVVMKRLAAFENMTPEFMLDIHNEYLEAAVSQILGRPSGAARQALHKWFELEIRSAGLPLNALTISYMLKASLHSPRDDRRNRLLRRYMDLAGQNGLRLQVLNPDFFGAEELNDILRISPEPSEEEFDELAEESILMEESDILDAPDSAKLDLVDAVELDRSPEQTFAEDVRPARQKGLGLKALRQALSLFIQDETSNLRLESRTEEEKRTLQTSLELDAVNSALDRWREESSNLTKLGLNSSLQTKSLGARMWRWQEKMVDLLKEELVKVDEAELMQYRTEKDLERCLYGPFLRLLDPEKMAAVSILSLMNGLATGGIDKGITLSSAIMGISTGVEEEILFDALQKRKKQEFQLRNAGKKDHMKAMTPSQLRRAKRSRGTGASKYATPGQRESDGFFREILAQGSWPASVKAKVGAVLMSSLIKAAKIPVIVQHPDTKKPVTQIQPAFTHSHQFRLGKRTGMIMANADLIEQLKREPVHSLMAKHLPMIAKPDPWTDFDKGGFLSQTARMMRIKLGDKDQKQYIEAAIDNGDMEQTFKGLDVLGKTPWRINQPVFQVMLEAWNSGEPVANLAPENPKFELPAEPDSSADPLERKKWIRAIRLMENAKSGLHSQRCFQNFQLEIARALRDEEFYFPHNIDFRGRAYPIPPYLNHMGADHCRGLLRFGRGRELGDTGLRWLKIHLANVFGFDKASLKEREEFATQHAAKILETASNPLKGDRWWLDADSPWQFLAACMELKNAWALPDPTKFVSCLAVHQDGTCNGLQHYAALGGDSWGAKQVNLEPGDRPADVYSAVANLVKESIASDKERGNPYAKVLDGRITRKIVKQTVMTNVYGVTFVGAKDQVRKALTTLYSDLPSQDNMHVGILSSYIATKIFTALSSMFRGAHDIQHWLGECANRISSSLTPEQIERMDSEWKSAAESSTRISGKAQQTLVDDAFSFKSSVIWTNPLHMPVVQPYRVSKSKIVKTYMQMLSITEPQRSNPVNKKKQLQGFPPNFIHSLDATHMLLSALKCDERGLSFAAVHDSFWTHAADVDSMNSVLREAFVRIHSEDVIGRLAAEFNARYKGSLYLAKVRSGTALYKKILELRKNAPRLPQGPRISELQAEYERNRLLASSNPEEVEQGKAMVTAGSLFQEMAAEGDLALDEDNVTPGIGDIPVREAKLETNQEIEVGDEANIEEIDNPLPGGTKSDLAKGDSTESSEGLGNDEPVIPTRRFASEMQAKTPRKASASTWVWLPLTFPPVPKKGDFDVARLRDSQYFFS